ncbi:hypothetical protein H8959_021801 [Pygathrix nigripes]
MSSENEGWEGALNTTRFEGVFRRVPVLCQDASGHSPYLCPAPVLRGRPGVSNLDGDRQGHQLPHRQDAGQLHRTMLQGGTVSDDQYHSANKIPTDFQSGWLLGLPGSTSFESLCPYQLSSPQNFSCEQPCNQTMAGNVLTFLKSLLEVFQKEKMRGMGGKI